jgi:hypothetical protein
LRRGKRKNELIEEVGRWTEPRAPGEAPRVAPARVNTNRGDFGRPRW